MKTLRGQFIEILGNEIYVNILLQAVKERDNYVVPSNDEYDELLEDKTELIVMKTRNEIKDIIRQRQKETL